VSEIQIVPLKGYEHAVRQMFWETITIGHPLRFDLNCARQYENLGLSWYLTAGIQDCAVAVVDNEAVGYCLVCTDAESFERSQKKLLVRLFICGLFVLLTGRINSESRRFYWYRLRDSVAIMRTRKHLPKDVYMHAHLNVHYSRHDGSISRRLRDHADAVCKEHGANAYFGEMNAVGGKRIISLRRVGGEVVSDSTNHTFSWLTGQDIHRLTLIRFLEPPVTQSEKQAA
jgi:hypothetical protein